MAGPAPASGPFPTRWSGCSAWNRCSGGGPTSFRAAKNKGWPSAAPFFRPRLLLLDEPLTGLDPDLRLRVLEYLRRVRDELAMPMLYVTHDAGDAALLADEVLWVEEGRLRACGKAADMLEPDPDRFPPAGDRPIVP